MTSVRPAPRPRTLIAWSLLAAAALGAPEARASGLSTARFGGEHGHPTTDNPTAIYYNPAGIALKPGTRIFVDGSFAQRWLSYERPADAVSDLGGGTPDGAQDANAGTARLSNQIFAPFAGVTSDFGTKFFSAGASVYFPFGGQSTWKPNEKYRGSQMYPGAVDGVQRWHTIDGKLRSMYITAAFAFNFAKIGLSIGASASAIKSEIDTIRARNTDGSDDLVDSTGLKEGRSWLKASGWQGGFGIGAVWQWRDKLWIGASYTSRPNVTGNMTLKGDLYNALGTSQVSNTPIELTQRYPDVIRLGIRARPVPKLELRVFGDFTNWKVMDKQCVLIATVDDRSCNFAGADTALSKPEDFGGEGDGTKGVTQHLPRFWKAAGGVRVGASYWVVDPVELFAGVGFDATAVPLATLDPTLYDANKMSFSLGGRFQVHRHLAIGLTLTDILYFKADNRGKGVINKFKSPTRQASADGIYKSNIFLTNLYFDVMF